MAQEAGKLVEVGDILVDKFRVESVLGEGGMGVVVKATHLQLEQLVAIKFMLPEAFEKPQMAERFIREARTAARLKGAHIAKILDVGKLENGAPYIVMEYLEGQDLSELIEELGLLPVSTAVEYVLQACVGMAEAHSQNIVHRDLKPANLFLTTSGSGREQIKVLDFGISKVLQADELTLTKENAMMGSPMYMSPEQMRSVKDVDSRTDIWALGTILYDLMCGRPPFEGTTLPHLCTNVLMEEPAPMEEFNSDIPAGLQSVVLRCLSKSADERYADVAELAAALQPFAESSAADLVSKVRGFLGQPEPKNEREGKESQAALADTTPVVAMAGMTQIGQPEFSALKSAPEAPSRAPAHRSRILSMALPLAIAVVAAIAALVFLRGGESDKAGKGDMPPAAKSTEPDPRSVATPAIPRALEPETLARDAGQELKVELPSDASIQGKRNAGKKKRRGRHPVRTIDGSTVRTNDEESIVKKRTIRDRRN